MTAPPPRRPWSRRKRTWAAVALWLVVAYPLSVGPVNYAYARGWLSREAIYTAYVPLWKALPDSPHPQTRLEAYMAWWRRLAYRHRADSDRPALTDTTDQHSLSRPRLSGG